MLIHPFKESFRAPFQEAFVALGTIIYPPIPDDLQIWLKGNDNGTDQKLDSWLKPDAENFDMLLSACPTINGVDEYGTINSAITLSGDFKRLSFDCTCNSSKDQFLFGHTTSGAGVRNRATANYWRVTIGAVNSQFTTLSLGGGSMCISRVGSTLTMSDGVTSEDQPCSTDDLVINVVAASAVLTIPLEGKLCNIRFKDSTKDIHFRCQEGMDAGATSFSSNYLTDGYAITWVGDIVNIRAGTQGTYPGNALYDWWEIYGDDVMYPYPVVGYDEHHKGGTFNDAETSFAPEEFFVGTANGVDHTITMLADHGSIVSHGLLDTSTPTYVHPTISLTAGIIRHILFSDGTLIKIDEGEGTDIHDADGNIVGTLNGDPVAFYSGAKMVSEAVIAMEATPDAPVYTDGSGHAVPLTQADIEALLEISNNKQYYFTNCPGKNRELINYKTPRTIAEDAEIKVFGCL